MITRFFLALLLGFLCSALLFGNETKEPKDGDRIIVVFGANWCSGCHVQADMVSNSTLIQKFIKEKYYAYLYLKDDERNTKPNTDAWFRKVDGVIRYFPTITIFEYQKNKWVLRTKLIKTGPLGEQKFLEFLRKGLPEAVD